MCIYYRADKSTLSGAFVVTGEKPPQPPHARTIIFIIILSPNRPAQLAELSRSEFDSELFSHSAYVKFFETFATKVSINILRQNETIFDKGNG